MSEKENIEPLVFGLADYFSLIIVVIISVLIGLYYSFIRKDNTIEEYLFGNRNLQIIPVALSIVATNSSSLSIISMPAEFYLYGSDICLMIFSAILNGIFIYLFLLPFFYGMNITTLYEANCRLVLEMNKGSGAAWKDREYLDKRFNGYVRTVCSVLYTLNVVLYMPVILNATSLTISQVCGINYYASTIIFGIVTTIYTAIGGIRGVVWSDVLQAFFMFIGVVTLAVKGTMDVNGFDVIWKTNYEGGRISSPALSVDFTQQYGIWAWIFGSTSNWIVFSFINQGCLQRYLSLPTKSDAKICFVLSSITSIIFVAITLYIGMLLFTNFNDCDPLKSHEIKRRDQMVPLYILKTLQNNPGVPGLIIASLVSAALSTLSTQLNSVAAIVLCDYYKPYINKNVSERMSTILLKVVVVILGIFVTGSTFVVRNVGTAMQALYTFSGTINGPILGTFIIGIFIPKLKSKATFFGSLAGLALITWISVGRNIAASSGNFRYQTKQLYTYGCEINITIVNATINNQRDDFNIYQISNLWYTTIGSLTTLVVASILNLFMERNDPSKMDRTLFSPMIHRFYPRKSENTNENEMSLLSTVKEGCE